MCLQDRDIILHSTSSGCSSFRADSHAFGLRKTTELFPNPKRRRKRLLICTDSQSLLMYLKYHIPGECTTVLAEMIDSLNKLSRSFRIRLQFVFSHCGVPGNERVDKEAEAALQDPDAKKYPKSIADALCLALLRLRLSLGEMCDRIVRSGKGNLSVGERMQMTLYITSHHQHFRVGPHATRLSPSKNNGSSAAHHWRASAERQTIRCSCLG